MEEIESKETKAPSRLMTIAAVAVLTLVAGGGGWLAGMLLAPPPAEKTEIPAELPANATGEEGIPKMSAVAHGIVQLDPITTNLAYPAENWVRLEVALQFDGAPDVALAETIHQDIAAYLKTVSLQQIQGPRGFQYLRDDIQERVDLRSEGRVTNVMFRTFVIQ
ncbi:flagellar basal body-associated protein FliL [Sinorhizobium meliloti]|jgi:flagellar protein FliL|uniref:Flagellar protein FliL n=1 Tax=Rhizobium meliloti (strain 1021) TaxID=266834 RepID=Q92RZ7_RHIME|nr:flagellar basal body-associated FliL family protein [Sinorhizobium meliloti]TWA89442.1 flagellar FliL protein [Ensifer sp. SEMIA 134]TWB25559.1 flagellar FliL protein [Ensifer sp. SEMIA 135]AEG03218.1 flagellar basal body-associated protein FliL [Sinorhizobium meliloti BL225C]AGA05626.1 Flagellar basal body-associated protein [Sinorhizobium meliloti GR4]AGG73247.1 Flagellar transmembrane protein [Sinorhizobium meliloti 2011]